MTKERIEIIDNLLNQLGGVHKALIEEQKQLKAEHFEERFGNLESSYEFFRDNFAWHVSRSLTVEKTVWWSVTGMPYTVDGLNWTGKLYEAMSEDKSSYRAKPPQAIGDQLEQIAKGLTASLCLGRVEMKWGGRQGDLLCFMDNNPKFRWVVPDGVLQDHLKAITCKWVEYREMLELRISMMERNNNEKCKGC